MYIPETPEEQERRLHPKNTYDVILSYRPTKEVDAAVSVEILGVQILTLAVVAGAGLALARPTHMSIQKPRAVA